MKAVAYHHYGSPEVLHCEESPIPVPADDQVLVRVHAASLNALDLHLLRGKPFPMRLLFGLPNPRTWCPGRDVAGVVAAVGKGVSGFQPGDEVFGICTGKSLMDRCDGSLAEYARTTATALALKPAGISFEQAAALPVAGLTALQALRDQGRLEAEQSVLVHGAGGGVGTFAVQIAKAMGAHVTAVTSRANLALMHLLGADQTIDYTREDFTRTGFRYDIVLDCFTSRSPLACGRILKPRGRYVMVGGPTGRWTGALFRMLTVLCIASFSPYLAGRKLRMLLARARAADLELLAQWTAEGAIHPVIDRTYPLEEAREAVRYFGGGQGHGKVVILVP